MVKECQDVAANNLGSVQCIGECHKYSCFVDVNRSKLMEDRLKEDVHALVSLTVCT